MNTPSPATMPWRPLALGWLGHGLLMLLLGGFGQASRPWLDPWFNVPILLRLHALSSAGADQAMQMLSLLGRGEVIALGSALVLLCLRGATRRVRFGVQLLGVVGLVLAGKLAFRTMRPHLWPPIEQVGGSSFPSSHAALALSLLVACGVLLPRRLWPTLGLGFVVLALSIGISRVYLGVHNPSDVLLTWMWVASWMVWTEHCFRASATTSTGAAP